MNKSSLINSKGLNVKNQIQWLALVMVLVGGIAGCASIAASDAVRLNDRNFYNDPVITDEIVAIGRPDASLSKALGKEHVVAFIGLKNTYLLYEGGEELEQIASLNLDGKKLIVDDSQDYRLYVKDKQVWGYVQLRYSKGALSADELSELNKGGFSSAGSTNFVSPKKLVSIQGTLYPPIKIPDDQLSRLGVHRPISLYHSQNEKPPMLPKILKASLIPVGIAVDTAVSPVIGVLGAIFTLEILAQ